ncbi:maleylpyruvate isomerase N-terminal domain-containing protein [Nonomuraea sp. 3N208]|uniref:maleylpyruvate isomerase N-terminal domain-containing protein n=1 Tax=Nonomuraea sp. 3N208 TaxID=3457421 RepID=UPI003FCEB8B9
MDRISYFQREVRAFQAAAREAAKGSGAPTVPSCPGWSMSDLVLHLGNVHRGVDVIIRDRLQGFANVAAAGPRPSGHPTSGLSRTAC